MPIKDDRGDAARGDAGGVRRAGQGRQGPRDRRLQLQRDRLAEALDISEREGLARYEVLQPEYNLMARDEFEGALQRLCVERELGVLPYFGLASGFLTGKYRSEADFGKSVRGGRMAAYLDERGRRVLAALDEVAAEAGATPAQVALAWLAAQPGVTAPIASATSLAQLDELLGVLTLELSAEQVRAADRGGGLNIRRGAFRRPRQGGNRHRLERQACAGP